jgi:hypothetical protein
MKIHGLSEIYSQPGLWKDDSGNVVNLAAYGDATRVITFENARAVSPPLAADRSFIILARYVRLPEHLPDALMSIFVSGAPVVDWCEISGFSYSNQETALGQRVRRLEAARELDLTVPAFGALRRGFYLKPEQSLTVEFDRPMTCSVVLEGLSRRQASYT